MNKLRNELFEKDIVYARDKVLILKSHFSNLKIEDMENISDILKRYHPDLSSLSVVNRRAQTIRSWLIALGMHK